MDHKQLHKPEILQIFQGSTIVSPWRTTWLFGRDEVENQGLFTELDEEIECRRSIVGGVWDDKGQEDQQEQSKVIYSEHNHLILYLSPCTLAKPPFSHHKFLL